MTALEAIEEPELTTLNQRECEGSAKQVWRLTSEKYLLEPGSC